MNILTKPQKLECTGLQVFFCNTDCMKCENDNCVLSIDATLNLLRQQNMVLTVHYFSLKSLSSSQVVLVDILI